MKKPNCYQCRFRGDLAGNAHSCCNHPEALKIKDKLGPIAELAGIFAGVGRLPGFTIGVESKQLQIQGNPHGIKNGWFIWPFNFDPTWLEKCSGFTPKEAK